MAQNEESTSTEADQADDASQADKQDLPENNVTVEEVGTARIKIKIEIPPERIEDRLDKDLDELRRTAAVPGFRVGRAPRKLIEKRFGSDARDSLKNVLVAEALQEAVTKTEIKTLGEPDLDIETIEIPDEGPLCFEVETDVEPEFELPELEGIAVTRAAAEITDESVDSAIKTMLAREGMYEPVEKDPAEERDQIVGDLWLKVDDNEVTRRDDMALLAGPTNMALMTVPLDDLCKKFIGAKSGDQVTAEVTVGDDHANEEVRGKKGVAGMDIKDIKRLKIPPLTSEWLTKAGWEDEKQFRSAVRENLQRQTQDGADEQMRGQIRDYLLSRVSLDLPEKLSAERVQRAESRQLVRIMQMGIPEDQAREVVSKQAETTRNQAVEETKLFFILNRIADEQNIEADDAEVNGQIAQMAGMGQTRPEKMRQQLEQTGQLDVLRSQIREKKVLDKLLSQAKVTELEPEKPVKKTAKKDPAEKTAAKSKKKAAPKAASTAKAKKKE